MVGIVVVVVVDDRFDRWDEVVLRFVEVVIEIVVVVVVFVDMVVDDNDDYIVGFFVDFDEVLEVVGVIIVDLVGEVVFDTVELVRAVDVVFVILRVV